MVTGKQYDEEYKKQAVKLAKEIGNKAAAEELGIPKGTLGTWLRKARAGEIDTSTGTRSPEESLNWRSSCRNQTNESKSLKRKIGSWKN